MITTDVENYPGFPEGITGPEMMELFEKQAELASAPRCCSRWMRRPWSLGDATPFRRRDGLEGPFTDRRADRRDRRFEAKLARACRRRSACAISGAASRPARPATAPCIRDKPLAVVGGGDTAMEESLFLTRFATKRQR